MRILKLTTPISIEAIKQNMQSANGTANFKRWQIIYFISAFDVGAAYLSDITTYSKASIYAIVQQFNNSKKGDVSIVARGGRRRSLMTIEEEQSFMKTMEDKALEGQILNYLDIKKLVEKQIGKAV